ncbi:MAG: hypothetical protein QOF53_4168 [Nocardioidaceae bacterium]|nr:hypothetical protein [Nocardioidaceae bacterium]
MTAVASEPTTAVALEASPVASEARRPVPWTTVLPLAIVLAYADGFWTTALRSSLGSIERSQGLAVSWLRESTLLVPVFVLAVLAALVVAQRRFGGRPRGFASIGAAMLMVAGFSTVAGAARLAASSTYDYHLQTVQMAMMDMMKNNCSAACRNAQLSATLGLQVRAVAVGSLILLVSNLLLVCWVVALRGGRIRLASNRAPVNFGRVVGDRLGVVRALVAAALIASAVVHATVVPGHLTEWSEAGLFFVALTTVELGLAGALLTGRRPLGLLPVVFAVDGSLLLWLYFRTFGIPFVSAANVTHRMEIVAIVVSVLEVVTLLVVMAILRARPWVRPTGSSEAALGRSPGQVLGSTLAAVVAVSALALCASSLSLVGQAGTTPTVGGHSSHHHAANV